MTTSRPAQPRTPWDRTAEADCHHASRVLEVVGRRWSPGILLALARGATRFKEIVASTEGISARMLTVRLTDLEQAGLVEREVIPTTPVSVRYRLTPRGIDLIGALRPIAGYVQRWEGGSPSSASS